MVAKLALAIFLFLISAPASRLWAFEMDFFVNLDGLYTRTEVAGVAFEPRLVRGGIGVFVLPGIGVELQSSLSSKADEAINISTGIESMNIAAVRLQSPSDAGFSAFAKFGYAQFELSTVSADGISKVLREDLSSPYFAIGLQKEFSRFSYLSYSFAYEHLYRDERVRLRGLSFGYAFSF